MAQLAGRRSTDYHPTSSVHHDDLKEVLQWSSSAFHDAAPHDATRRPRDTLMIVLLGSGFRCEFLGHSREPTALDRRSCRFLLAIGLPAWMLSQKIDWRTAVPSERLVYSVVSAIFGLMVIGLVINTILPHVGISRPLDRGPVLVAVDVWCGLVALWRPQRFRPTVPASRMDKLQGADWTVCLLSALCVPLAIIGANRLNNQAGSGVTLVMLFLAAITLLLMFAKRETLNAGTLTSSVYFIALAMLLMTSLRGWYITGHDIQSEYRVFELTKNNGDWNISRERDGYNSCLSLTILPTMLWQLIRVDDPYIFKFWFQLLFALCPVLVYRIGLRYTNRTIAIIATIYFIAFPTYFTDMPFLNRQEIAYLFVGACILTATDPALPHTAGRSRVAIFSLGVVLSHYSTAYVFLGIIVFSWFVYKVLTFFQPDKSAARESTRAERTRAIINPAISIVNVALLLVGIVLWNGVATHTANNIVSVVSQSIQSLRGGSDNKSTSTSYSLFGGGAPPPSQVLSDYSKSTLVQTNVQRTAAGFFSEEALSKYPATAVPEPNLPITSLGHLLDDSGLNVATLNSVVRAGAARLLQLFLALGLFSALRSWRRRPSRSITQLIALTCGAIVILALQVVLPVVSADYGVLRAFQQAMLASAPLVAVGTITLFGFLGEKWSSRAAFAIAIVYFSSLVGAVPQTLGGYAAQLNLNNSGQYYDIYYTQPQDITAIKWLQSRIPDQAAMQPEVQMDQYSYSELQTFTNLNVNNNDFPTLLQAGFLRFPRLPDGDNGSIYCLRKWRYN